jgi:hypothetical protein
LAADTTPHSENATEQGCGTIKESWMAVEFGHDRSNWFQDYILSVSYRYVT